MLARDMTRDQLAELLETHGSAREVAKHLGQPPTTVGDAYRRIGLVAGTQRPPVTRPTRKGCLTRDHLTAALTPPNNCAVRALLDRMEPDEQDVLNECLAYSTRDFTAQQIVDMLVTAGYREAELPGTSAINDHRAGRRPCRCRG